MNNLFFNNYDNNEFSASPELLPSVDHIAFSSLRSSGSLTAIKRKIPCRNFPKFCPSSEKILLIADVNCNHKTALKFPPILLGTLLFFINWMFIIEKQITNIHRINKFWQISKYYNFVFCHSNGSWKSNH